jgi:hypothetical protein
MPRQMHRAYGFVQEAERCWTDSDDQAWKRARLVVRVLADAGLLVGAEVLGDHVVQAESNPTASARSDGVATRHSLLGAKVTMSAAPPKPPAFIVLGEWSDPPPENRRPPRSHPYGPLAWTITDGDQRLVFPNRAAALEYHDRVIALGEPGRSVSQVEAFRE